MPFSASQSPEMAVAWIAVPYTLQPWDLLTRALLPVPDEVAAMVCDLRSELGGEWRQVVQATGIAQRTMTSWINGGRKPPPASARAVWLCWCLVCRPGAIQTIYDLATSGRFTDGGRGDPATAGTQTRAPRPKYKRKSRRKPRPPLDPSPV